VAASLTSTDLARAVAELRWYHTIDLPCGVTTPGRYDHRSIVDALPWPDLRGLRCLDIGSRDGFFAFEMERRGASEVVSLDIADPSDVDFPRFRPPPDEVRAELDRGNRAFEFAREALGSRVRRELRSVYDLQVDAMGMFDFATIGTLLLHLRDPLRALAAIRSVLDGPLLLNEVIDPYLELFRRRPLAEATMPPGLPMWWGFNRRGLERIVTAAGFDVVEVGRPYLLPNGPGAPRRGLRSCFRGALPEIMHNLVQTRGDVHVWLVARPIP
jgi:tRNA (mo5U34)-methyltransferase